MSLLFASLLLAGGPELIGRASLVPTEPLPLGGYTARKDKVADPGGEEIWARALVLRAGSRRIAIVSFEGLTVPESLVVAVQLKIGAETDLFLAGTHTHSAPDSQMLNDRMTFKIPGIAAFKRRQLEWTADQVAAAIRSATPVDPSREVRIGRAKVDLNRGRRAEAKPDPTATWISVGHHLAITHYAAHATVFEEDRNQIHGDWPGSVMSRLGGLVLVGPIGDVSPKAEGSTPVEKCAFMVEKLHAGLASTKGGSRMEHADVVRFIQVPIELPEPNPHPNFAKSNQVPDSLAQVLVKRFAPPVASVTFVQWGHQVLVGIPGEPTSEIGRSVQGLAAKAGFPHALVVSHVNGWIGYILTPEDYDRGGYEATLAFHGRGLAERVLKTCETGLQRLGESGTFQSR